MESNIFIYISMAEGVMICALLAWEIFWLSRMYKVLYNMPTAEQVDSMVKVIKEDGEKITKVVGSIGELVNGFKLLAGLAGKKDE